MPVYTTHRLCGKTFNTPIHKRCTQDEAMEMVEIDIDKTNRRRGSFFLARTAVPASATV